MVTIANIFMKKFNIHASSGNNSSETSDTPTLHGIVSLDHLKDDVDDISVEDVDRAVFSKLKRGKAHGCDGLSPEHLVYCHPSLIIQLKLLFNAMLKRGYVPDRFGIG